MIVKHIEHNNFYIVAMCHLNTFVTISIIKNEPLTVVSTSIKSFRRRRTQKQSMAQQWKSSSWHRREMHALIVRT